MQDGGKQIINMIKRILLLSIIAGFLFTFQTIKVSACAFLNNPHTYEAEKNRLSYLNLIENAASNNLFNQDPYFNLPTGESGTRTNRREIEAKVPGQILKSIAWIESELLMATTQVAYNSKGPALVAFDCGYGIMQVTTGMEKPRDGKVVSPAQVLIATHPAYNIAEGAKLLASKWNQAPQSRPIVGTDTDSNPEILENWYFAVWSYNGFSGPGTNQSNHPLDPIFNTWPRPSYTCDGRYPKNMFPYQELVWGCIKSPPSVTGNKLWKSVNISLPNLSSPTIGQKLSISNFRYPYNQMDIASPQPIHYAEQINLSKTYSNTLLGLPKALLSKDKIKIQTNIKNNNKSLITINNTGSGLLSWNAYTTFPWIVLDIPAGVALGKNVSCVIENCKKQSEIVIKINPTLLPDTRAIGKIVIQFPNAAIVDQVITVDVFAEFNAGIAGISKIY